MEKIVVTPNQLQTMYDTATASGILPQFIEKVAFHAIGEGIYADLFFIKPRQRKQRWWMYSFAADAFYVPLPRRRSSRANAA